VRNARAAGKTAVQMAPDGAADLVKLWNHEQRNFGGGTITRLYWDVNVARIEGVLGPHLAFTVEPVLRASSCVA
jgi:hypothetical protein